MVLYFSTDVCVPEADAVADYMADTHRDISPPEVDAVELDTPSTRQCGNCATSSAFRGLTLNARPKPQKDSMAKTMTNLDFPSLPIHSISDSSSEANSLVFADRDQGNIGCGVATNHFS